MMPRQLESRAVVSWHSQRVQTRTQQHWPVAWH